VPKKPDKPPERDSVAREVDRLLRQLPGADPSLKGDSESPSAQAAAQRLQMSGPRPAAGRVVRERRPPQPWGVWARLGGAVVLGVALTQWPYRSECGWSLYGYLAAVAAVLLAAGWTAVAAWQLRMGAAHALALVAGFWGVVLAAEQILPRIGYASETQYWSCTALRAARAPAVLPTRVAPILVPAPADSLLTDSAVAGTPNQPQRVDRQQ